MRAWVTGTVLVAAALAAAGCRRSQPAAPARPDAATVRPDAAVAVVDAEPPRAPEDAGPPPAAVVRLRNVGTAPITVLTNPDVNEMLHTWRINVPDERSDRAVYYLNDPALLVRVKLFPVDLPRCDVDASAGFGGLGQTGSRTLAPGESWDFATWDGLAREEVNDPTRGVCLREAPAAAGRYRFHFDQPNSTRPECDRALFRVPLAGDGGVPVIEIRCRPRPDGSVVPDEE